MPHLTGKKRFLLPISVLGLTVFYMTVLRRRTVYVMPEVSLREAGSDLRPLEEYLTGTFETCAQETMGCRPDAPEVPGIRLKCYEAIAMHKRLPLATKRSNFYNVMLRTTADCAQPELLGTPGDGGWYACKQEPFTFKQPCLVYSFGISKDWSFDNVVSEKYGCEVHSFDPSIGLPDHKHSDRVYFHNIGLGGINEMRAQQGSQWRTMTFCTILRELGHSNRTIDYLKFDIEFSEWGAMIAMLNEGCLKQVKQLSLETHAWGDTSANYTMFWWGLHGLENAGFQKWRVFSRNWRCFRPVDEPHNARCPQADLSYFNAHYLTS